MISTSEVARSVAAATHGAMPGAGTIRDAVDVAAGSVEATTHAVATPIGAGTAGGAMHGPAGIDAARAAVVARASEPGQAAIADARTGPLHIPVLADEGHEDGTNIVTALRNRGVRSDIWDLRHLRADDAGGLTYRGQAVPTPDLVVAYHGAMVPEGGMDTMRAMERSGIPFVNSPQSIANSRDKAITAGLFAEAGVASPETHLVTRPEDVGAAVAAVTAGGSPAWFKDPIGTMGVGVARVSNPKEAVAVGELILAQPGRRLLVQKSIPLPDGVLKDTRAFVVGDEVVAAMDRVQDASTGEFRTNLSNNDPAMRAKGHPTTLTREQAATALQAKRALGLDVAGIDLMGDYVVEGNSGPGQKIKDVTGIDVGDRIAAYAVGRAQAARAATT